ncbi:conserved hypothetical protein [Ricinus communis]|uniref:Uncharacterized protein n=1 Tax=Ricinus communis TaxID=3988 RepID=B9T5V2_RICCO|nr:conserved hypothetical protein [Ricinus communis]
MIKCCQSGPFELIGLSLWDSVLVVGGSGGELMGEDDADLRGPAIGGGDPGVRLVRDNFGLSA